MLRSIYVAALHEKFDHLAGRLLRDPKVVRHVHHGRVASADADEGESVGRPDIGESALGKTSLYPIDELRGSTQKEGCCGESIRVGHLPSLTEWSIPLII